MNSKQYASACNCRKIFRFCGSLKLSPRVKCQAKQLPLLDQLMKLEAEQEDWKLPVWSTGLLMPKLWDLRPKSGQQRPGEKARIGRSPGESGYSVPCQMPIFGLGSGLTKRGCGRTCCWKICVYCVCITGNHRWFQDSLRQQRHSVQKDLYTVRINQRSARAAVEFSQTFAWLHEPLAACLSCQAKHPGRSRTQGNPSMGPWVKRLVSRSSGCSQLLVGLIYCTLCNQCIVMSSSY